MHERALRLAYNKKILLFERFSSVTIHERNIQALLTDIQSKKQGYTRNNDRNDQIQRPFI